MADRRAHPAERSLLEEQLLASVIASPDEDGPRLVYADWLIERSEERGDFIREQCQLAQMDETDAGYSALYAKTERCWLRHHKDWAPSLGDWASPMTMRARRGFVEEVTVRPTEKKPLVPLAELARSTPLRAARFEIRHLPWSTVPWSLEGVALRELHLDASYPSFWREEPNHGALRALTGLCLSNAWDPPPPPEPLHALLAGTALRELSVGWSGFGDADLRGLMEAGLLETIASIDLSQTSVRRETLLPLLNRHRPRRIGLSPDCAAQLDLLQRTLVWPLEALDVRGEAAARLPSWPHLGELRELVLSLEHVRPELLEVLPFDRLTRLRLEGSSGLDEQLKVIARAPRLQTLRRLDLGSYWGFPQLKPLFSSPYLRDLLALSLPYLDDEGARTLAEWEGLTNLCHLSLPNHRLSKRGIEALVASPVLDPVRLDLPLMAKHKPLRELVSERFGAAVKG